MQPVFVPVSLNSAALKGPAGISQLFCLGEFLDALFRGAYIPIVVTQCTRGKRLFIPRVVLHTALQLGRFFIGQAWKALASAVLLVIGVDRFHKFLGLLQPLQLFRQLGDGLRIIGGNGGVILCRLRPALIIVGFIGCRDGLAHFIACPFAVACVCRAHNRLARWNCANHIPGLPGQRITLGAGFTGLFAETVNAFLFFLLVFVQKIILSDSPA